MKDKKALVRKSAFSRSLSNFLELPTISLGLAYTKLTEKIVAQALLTQVASKVLDLNIINFQVL